jgi:UDP-N-acetyl-D-mannosaminuronic acid dehydrogenase
MKFEKLVVIGLGYIGLPTAATFASCGLSVIGVDVNPDVVETINRGDIHIVEPDLDQLVHVAVASGRLRATASVEAADCFIVAVPTPFKDNKQPDLRYIEAAAKAIAPVLRRGNLVVLESTSPVGATEQMAAWLAQARPDLTFPQQTGESSDIRVAHCPERVLPGRVLVELISNDRVIGGMTNQCSQAAVDLYRLFVQGECVVTTARTAEMCKLTENSFRDVNIAFANELSIICDKLDINVWELIRLANRHPRVNVLQPGPGVGGHCIAVDPWFIVASAPDEAKLIRTARLVNDHKPDWVIEKVQLAIASFLQDHPNKTIKDVTIACYGLAFKPDIDDLRESPSLEICKTLSSSHAGQVIAVEPNISVLNLPKVKLVSMREADQSADIKVILVRHKQFNALAFSSRKYVIDTQGF